MLTIYWQMDVVFLEAFTIFPLYVSLLIDIWTNRKKQKLFQSPYYTLILSQGLADILIILTIFNLLVARYFGFGNMLLYNIQDYGVASFHSNTGPLMFIVRMFGIFLITSQRYVAVCWHGSRLNVFIDRLHPLILVAIHYIFPCVIYIPAFIVSSAKFQDTERLFIINTPTHLQTFSIIVVSSFLVASVLVVFMYLSILRVLFITRKNGKNSMGQCVFRQQALRYREIRLAAHVFLLSVMSATIFVYYWIEFSMAGNPDVSSELL
ncbi:hypothetical protein CRE_13024 [Caenorhabditis remanei]|uniref:G-protein coupled receptors family 1 profile domain-containing protein n=1 Tax=Caenorhabditis remanei TaxID=31234 RepID=E3N7C9_CAERE|nr:hypothetical protein CRE_13024 [Caenorhabditis remanei]